MTLKPPTRTLPKVVMKEWPEQIIATVKGDCPVVHSSIEEWQQCKACEHIMQRNLRSKSLSDFTRVVEETGILEQEEAPLRKPGSQHD